jgi:RNA polymerase sigma-70 factor (ECF subfamily)
MCQRPAYRKNVSLDATSGPGAGTSSTKEVVDPAAGPETKCIEAEKAAILARAIHHLPAYQRDVIQMYHSEGKSYETIATATGMSIGTVKSRLNRARTMLRERLTPMREILLTA